jgi:molybdenum cofactor biosynthesis protein B
MASQSTQEHREEASKLPPARVAVLTVSDTRTEATDKSGLLIRELLTEQEHTVVRYAVLPDDPPAIRAWVREAAESGAVDAVLVNGGTGIAPRDGTFEALSELLDRTLPGFGELFRMLSWEEVGAASMLSRAVAGLHGRVFIFSMPGSSNAVRLAMTRLILPELAHLIFEVNKGRK